MSSATRSSAESASPRECLVTVFSKKPAGPTEPSSDIIWSEVWDVEHPLALSYPFRWVLQKSGENVRIRDLGAESDEVISHPAEEFPIAELSRRGVVELAGADGKRCWWLLIQPVQELKALERAVDAGGWIPTAIETVAASELPAQQFFKKTSIAVGVLMALCFLSLFFFPKNVVKEEALIPEQFAKMLLSPALKQSVASRGNSGQGGGSTNVVQAFQSAAVQKTTKQLLDSRAAKALLSGSTLLNTSASSALARKVFDTKTSLNQKLSGQPLAVASKEVGMMGGGNGGTGTGANTGYGTGGGARVEGQGNGSVTVEGKDVGVSEGLTKAEVGKVIRDHMAEVRYCYDAALLRNPALEGKVVLNFTIRKAGNVAPGAQVKENSNDQALDQCILKHLMTWKFPKPRGAVDVEISYPFLFKVLGN